MIAWDDEAAFATRGEKFLVGRAFYTQPFLVIVLRTSRWPAGMVVFVTAGAYCSGKRRAAVPDSTALNEMLGRSSRRSLRRSAAVPRCKPSSFPRRGSDLPRSAVILVRIGRKGSVLEN